MFASLGRLMRKFYLGPVEQICLTDPGLKGTVELMSRAADGAFVVYEKKGQELRRSAHAVEALGHELEGQNDDDD